MFKEDASALSINYFYVKNNISNTINCHCIFWERFIDDQVSVNLEIKVLPLADGAEAKTIAEYVDVNFSDFKRALKIDQKSKSDSIFLEGLPRGDSYKKLINGTFESERLYKNANYVAAGASAMALTRANAKALGLVAPRDIKKDATIVINSSLMKGSYAGVDINSQFHLRDVLFHETAHALGFVSGVNILDYFYFYSGVRLFHKQYERFANPLDFTRCSDESAMRGADMDWTVSNEEKHFSLSNKCIRLFRVENAWSRGAYLGDGFEAGHWRNTSLLGVMVPSAAEANYIGFLDLLALDVIGWDLVGSYDEVKSKLSATNAVRPAKNCLYSSDFFNCVFLPEMPFFSGFN